MKIAITGANGFIGRKVVEQGAIAGHTIIAISRSTAPHEWQEKENVSVVHCDLLEEGSLPDIVQGCDVLIHLAAAIGSEDQYNKTLQLTKNVLAGMEKAGVKKLVGLSSISVLDYINLKPMSVIDENTPINKKNDALGPYAMMKRDQEALYNDWKNHAIIIRPGIVYSDNNLSSAHVGFIKGDKGIAATHQGAVPVVHVDCVARALITASRTPTENETIHLVNDDLPNQKQYISSLKQRGIVNSTIPLPWQVFSGLIAGMRLPLNILNKVPDSFRRNSVAARQKPFQFSNTKAKQLLNWQPKTSLNI